MSKINKRVLLAVSVTFLFAFFVVSLGQVNVNNHGNFDFGPVKTFATGDGGGDGGGGDGGGTVGTGDGGGVVGCTGNCFLGCSAPKYYSESYYLQTNPDVKAAVLSGQFGGSGYNHYIQHGQYENRTPNPICSPKQCTNGATNYPYCNNNVCTNGATNYPGCNICPANHVLQNGQCVYKPPTCTNGATNYPYCNNNVCTNGATNFPYCNNNVCTNGATNYPGCNICPANHVLQNGQCVYKPPTCTNGATNYPYCNNNVCTNGATNFPYCNNNVCTNGATNFPHCNNQCVPQGTETRTQSCSYGQTGIITQQRTHSCPGNIWTDWYTTSNTCVTNTCMNGATNYPYCNNNVCTNGATNFPLCNNNVCTNGATNYPHCNNVCTNGYTNYPTCGPTTCTNGCTNYPNCTTCPTGYSLINGQCVYQVINYNYCSNGATNYPLCNNNISYNYCANGATNFPYCNNQYVPPVNNPCTNCNTPVVTNYQELNVSTTGATPLTTTATIYGHVNSYNTNATIWFDYGTSYGNLQWQTTRQSTSYAGQFSAALSGLQCGTRYYYRAAAQNSYGTKYGSILSFVTQNCGYQNYNDSTVITRLATAVGYYSAQFNGSYITSNVQDRSCQAFFDYGTSYGLGKRTAGQTLYNNTTVNYFSKAVYGLSPNTTYYYRAGVTCMDGTKYGNIVSFRTPTYIVSKTKPKVTYTEPVAKTEVKNTATCLCDDDYMLLVVENLENAATPGKLANFRVLFKNSNKERLQNIAIRVVLPEAMTIYSSDVGQYTKGGKTLLLTIPTLESMQEGGFIVTANVDANTPIGQQMIVNAYADFTVPTVVKSGVPRKGEVTAYTMSIAGNATSLPIENGKEPSNSSTTTSLWSWLPTNFMDWVIAILVFAVFISALRYVVSAFRSTN